MASGGREHVFSSLQPPLSSATTSVRVCSCASTRVVIMGGTPSTVGLGVHGTPPSELIAEDTISSVGNELSTRIGRERVGDLVP